MRTTVDLDPKLLEQLRLEAVRRGVSVKALLNTVIRAGLAARVSEPVVKYRAETVSMGLPLADIDKALQLASALDDDETVRKLHLRK